ncbi:hypothetical protein [Candidatus Cardinium sp. cBcalN1]|uniref:hypothetical protein n=1 Tax=Candidatus Cardinium sp. cBcalN1 TaxID=2699437 RepID=UPI001FB1F1B5|nr:hypothetical protein [Candidatus Cardinium sp. cBcalN1]
MNLKKYSSYIIALLFCHGCDQCDNNAYKQEEEKGYYTKNLYKLDKIESFETTITTLQSPDEITKFRKKLADRSPKWSVTGTEKKPYRLWISFYNKAILENIVKEVAKKHDSRLLENFFKSFGKLFKEPTEATEKEVIASLKKLKAHTTLVAAFKECIAERYNKPETIYLSQETLEYEEFLYFILNESNKNNRRHIKLKKLQVNLKKWKKDGLPSGEELWKKIQEQEEKEKRSLQNSKIYRYKENQQAIAESLRLINQLMHDPYSLTYKDLLETLPHGKNKLENILDELLENRDHINIQSLKRYLRIVPDCL